MSAIVMIGLFIVLGYFMLVRPARRQAQKQEEMLGTLEPGARVMTRVGIYGTLVDIGEVQCQIEVAPGIILTMDKNMLAGVTPRSREEYWIDPNAPAPDSPAELTGDLDTTGLDDISGSERDDDLSGPDTTAREESTSDRVEESDLDASEDSGSTAQPDPLDEAGDSQADGPDRRDPKA